MFTFLCGFSEYGSGSYMFLVLVLVLVLVYCSYFTLIEKRKKAQM